MSALVHFHTADVALLFSIIGSADRDLLRNIGLTPGAEFREALEQDDEMFFEDEEDEPQADAADDDGWDAEAEEADAAREALFKMIMSGIPADLSEDEAYAIQDYFASYVHREKTVQPIEPEEVVDYLDPDTPARTAEAVRRLMAEGLALESLQQALEWFRGAGASAPLLHSLEMLVMGRLPESDEPTFTDLEDEAYAARFSYLTAAEAAQIGDELDERAPSAPPDLAPVVLLLAALMSFLNAQACDLVAVIEE